MNGTTSSCEWPSSSTGCVCSSPARARFLPPRRADASRLGLPGTPRRTGARLGGRHGGGIGIVSALTPEFANRSDFVRGVLPPGVPGAARIAALAFGLALAEPETLFALASCGDRVGGFLPLVPHGLFRSVRCGAARTHRTG